MANHEETAQPEAVPVTTEKMIEDVASSVSPVLKFFEETANRLIAQVSSLDSLYQLLVVAVAFGIALLAFKPLSRVVDNAWPRVEAKDYYLPLAHQVVRRLAFPVAWVLGLWIGVSGLASQGIGNDFVRVAASLLQAWILIRLFSTFVRNPVWARIFATVAWVIAALSIMRLLDPTIAVLDSMAIGLGDTRLSLFMVLKGAALLALLLWSAALVSKFVQSRLTRSTSMTASVKTLIGQTVRIGSYFFAVMFAMNVIGVDLTAFAVFSGAIGIGIGFGLQAIFSNLVAGIIMLIEQSVKVGDFVELESGLMGEVKEINIRATLVRTGMNVDILVPNSEFINNRVTNWTLRDAFVRTRIPFGVAYGTDKELVKKAALEAAGNVPHMLTGPDASPPQVWLVGFGESSLDFELVLMLNPDAVKRPGAVKADYNWALETALSKYGIEIPFPQRDLHMRSGNLPINLTSDEEIDTPANIR